MVVTWAIVLLNCTRRCSGDAEIQLDFCVVGKGRGAVSLDHAKLHFWVVKLNCTTGRTRLVKIRLDFRAACMAAGAVYL